MAYPSIAAVAASATPATATTHLCALPAGIKVGDLLLAVVVCDGDAAMTWPAGWTAPTNGAGASGTAVRSEARYRIAEGAEGAELEITGGDVAWVSRVWALRGHAGTAPECAAATGSAADVAPPSLTPSWSGQVRSRDTLYLVHVAWDTRPSFTFWPAPGFGRPARLASHVSDSGGGSGWVQQASAGVKAASGGLAPGPCTSAAAAWRALLIGVEPAVDNTHVYAYGVEA
jgi:hypothetical protein